VRGLQISERERQLILRERAEDLLGAGRQRAGGTRRASATR
jgi:hypothetical protein